MCERDELGKIREKVRVAVVEVEGIRMEETRVHGVVMVVKEDEKRKCSEFFGFFKGKK